MAGLHSGSFKINCPGCKIECDYINESAIWEYDDFKFYSCPGGFLNDQSCDWFNQYDEEAEMGTSLPYFKQSSRYSSARRFYKSVFNDLTNKKYDNKPDKINNNNSGLIKAIKKDLDKRHGRDKSKSDTN